MRTGTLWNRGIMGMETQWEWEHHGDGNTMGVGTLWEHHGGEDSTGMGTAQGWGHRGNGDTQLQGWRRGAPSPYGKTHLECPPGKPFLGPVPEVWAR